MESEIGAQVEAVSVGHVNHMADLAGQERGLGIKSWQLVSVESGSTQMLAGITEIPVGGKVPLHNHSCEEFIMLLDGSATVYMGEIQDRIVAGDSTHVLPGVAHQLVNNGESPLRILWVYGEPNPTRTLLETGEVLGHLDPYPSPSEPTNKLKAH
jgi:putative monooxygenase